MTAEGTTKSVLSARPRDSGDPGRRAHEPEDVKTGFPLARERTECGAPAAPQRKRRPRAALHPVVRRTLSFRRRLKVAGLPAELDWDSLNEHVRARLAAMWRDDWHGCPLPACRRHRGCMAPYLYCTNRALTSPRVRGEVDADARERGRVG